MHTWETQAGTRLLHQGAKSSFWGLLSLWQSPQAGCSWWFCLPAPSFPELFAAVGKMQGLRASMGSVMWFERGKTPQIPFCRNTGPL